MSFSKALYYPTIDIEDENLLKTAVLFWDEINTIVPQSIEDPYQNNSTTYLSDVGFLKPIIINPDAPIVKSLSQITVNHITTNEANLVLQSPMRDSFGIHRDKLPRKAERLFRLHPEKMAHEVQDLLDEITTQEDRWFYVNSGFAHFYMTLLANTICEQKSIALLTENDITSKLSEKVRLDNQRPIQRSRYPMRFQDELPLNLSQALMSNLAIQGLEISAESTLEDLIKFKEKYSDELGKFRVEITRLVKGVEEDVASFEALIQRVNDIYQNEFLPAYNDLKKSLKGAKIKYISKDAIKISFFSTSSTSIPMSLLGMSVPHALIAGVGVSFFASVVNYNVEKQNILRNSPYSYLLSINSKA